MTDEDIKEYEANLREAQRMADTQSRKRTRPAGSE